MVHVTVAIPFYNNAETIRAAVQSVFCQTYTNWELILLDDGSTDNSLSIVQAIRDPRVRVISDGRNRGLVYRLNQAVSLARGELFSRMDADDLMHPERLAKQVEFLRDHPEVDLIGTSVYTTDPLNVPIGLVSPIDWKGFKTPFHPTVTGPTSWFRTNPYNPDPLYLRAADLELWIRTQASTNVANLSHPLHFYLKHGGYSYRKYWESHLGTCQVIRTYGPLYRGRWWTYVQLADSWVKIIVHSVFNLTSNGELLARRHVRPLPTEEYEDAERTIGKILATPVRGLYPAGVAAD
jgi:glycosyltransferase involved in cell wall biosynthesis